MLAVASSSSLPCETQPGRAGHWATIQPSSAVSRVMGKVMGAFSSVSEVHCTNALSKLGKTIEKQVPPLRFASVGMTNLYNLFTRTGHWRILTRTHELRDYNGCRFLERHQEEWVQSDHTHQTMRWVVAYVGTHLPECFRGVCGRRKQQISPLRETKQPSRFGRDDGSFCVLEWIDSVRWCGRRRSSSPDRFFRRRGRRFLRRCRPPFCCVPGDTCR